MLGIKKIFAIVFALVLVFGTITTTPVAADNSDKVNSEKVNSILNEGVLSKQKGKLTSDDGTEYLVDIYEKTKKLDSNSYVTEYAFKLNKEHMKKSSSKTSANKKLSVSIAGDSTDHFWDSTGDVEGWVTIYFNSTGTKYLITRTTGTWLIHQSGTAIKDKVVLVVNNEGFFADQYIKKSITTSSFDITTNFTRYADASQGLVGIGAKSSVTVYRISSGSSWKFEIDNVIAGSLPAI